MNKVTLRKRESDGRQVFFYGPAKCEFGWEVANFQNSVRHHCEKRPNAYHIVMAESGHWPMYMLADEFWDLPYYLEKEFGKNNVYRETARIFFRGADQETKRRIKEKERQVDKDIQEELDSYGSVTIKSGKEMMLHYSASSSNKLTCDNTKWLPEEDYFCVSYRYRTLNDWGNWELDKWYKLIDLLQEFTGIDTYKVLGRPEEIKIFGGKTPKRKDENLLRSISLLNNCKFSITPESGSGFLSTACGAPTITFGHENHRARYKKKWNPIGSPVCYIGSPNRTFTPKGILNKSKGFLNAKSIKC